MKAPVQALKEVFEGKNFLIVRIFGEKYK